MIPRSVDGDVVVPGLGVELGRGQKAGRRNADGARLAVAVVVAVIVVVEPVWTRMSTAGTTMLWDIAMLTTRFTSCCDEAA